MRLITPIAFLLGLALPATAVLAKDSPAPLTVKERYADRIKRDPGFGFDTVPVAKVKVRIVVPLDPVLAGEQSAETVMALTLGDLEFDETLGSAEKWVPGKLARWTILDDDTGKPYLRVKASFGNGELKIVVKGRNEDGALSYWFTGEEDLEIVGEPLDADLTFGRAEYVFEGTFDGKADTKLRMKAGEEFDVSIVSLSGTAVLTERPEDLEEPEVDIFDPWDDDELDLPATEVVWEAADDTSLAKVEYRVNGGEWTALAIEVEIDPDFGDAYAEGEFTIATPMAGAYELSLRATDGFGHATTVTVRFTVSF